MIANNNETNNNLFKCIFINILNKLLFESFFFSLILSHSEYISLYKFSAEYS